MCENLGISRVEKLTKLSIYTKDGSGEARRQSERKDR